MLLELLDRLDESIGAGANVSTLRTQLSAIRDQAEALEARLKVLEAQINELEAKAQKEDVTSDKNSLKEEARKFLQLLARPDRPTLEEIASALGIEEYEAEYHADTLVEKGLIELAGAGPFGLAYVLTAKGRAYLVENK